MNKLLLNQSARNHIRIFPMKDIFNDIPEDEGDKIRWCETKFKELQHSDTAKRLCIYKHRLKGYLISVWEHDGNYYFILCLRNEFKTFNDTIYISKNREDMLSIAKFVNENIEGIMADYKGQILDARDELLRERNKIIDESEVTDVDTRA